MNIEERLQLIRQAVADYMASEGCSCCEHTEEHSAAALRIGELLNIPMYTDGSGIDFWQFRSENDGADEPFVNDLSDDAEALASAGWGTDEDYGG